MNKSSGQNRYRPNTSRETTAGSFSILYGIELAFKVIIVAGIVTVITLLFIFIENVITQSNLLAINEISVSGTHILSKEEVIEQAEIYPDDNIFSINLRHTRLRIISHPWIEDASVRRSLPSKIVIDIKEEVPLAVVNIPDKADIIINKKGVPFTENDAIGSDIFVNDISNSTGVGIAAGKVLDTAEKGEPNIASEEKSASSGGSDTELTLPVITGLKLSKHGDTYDFSGKMLNSVMELLLMKQDNVIQKIIADPESGLEVYLLMKSALFPYGASAPPRKVVVKIGFDNYQEKFKIIRHIVNYMQKNRINKQIESIDLVNPENVVVKTKDITVNALPEHIEGGA